MLSLSQFDLPLSSLSMLSDHIQQTVGAYDQRDCHQPRLLEVHQLGTELLGLALRLLDLDLLQDPTVRTSISSLKIAEHHMSMAKRLTSFRVLHPARLELVSPSISSYL